MERIESVLVNACLHYKIPTATENNICKMVFDNKRREFIIESLKQIFPPHVETLSFTDGIFLLTERKLRNLTLFTQKELENLRKILRNKNLWIELGEEAELCFLEFDERRYVFQTQPVYTPKSILNVRNIPIIRAMELVETGAIPNIMLSN